MAKKKKPAIRFKGFIEEWEQCRLSDIATMKARIGWQGLTQKEFLDKGDYYLITGTDFENGQINFTNCHFISKDRYEQDTNIQVKNGDVLITKDGTIGKVAYIRGLEKPATLNTGVFVIKGKDKNVINLYLYHYLAAPFLLDYASKQATGGTIKHLNQNVLVSFPIPLPKVKEQQKIGNFFRNLDYLITLHQRKYDKLQNIKKSMLEKMFPQNGKNIPEIRFKGFKEYWEQRKFGEIVDSYTDPVPTPHDGYIRLGIRSHAKGTFHNYVEKGKELETAQMHKVVSGNFIVNITFGWEHAVAITDENDAGKLVSHRFPQFQFHEQLVPEFFKYVILDDKFRHHLWVASPGGAGRNRVLKINELLEYKMIFPCEEEQQKIATFFKYFDHLITLHKRKLEKLQNIKKSCLEKMFV